MKENKTKPDIRFKGFTEAWEQRKLGDIVQITMGQSPNGETYSEEPSTYILVQGNADLNNGWVVPRVWTTQLTKQADKGDLIMSVRAPAGTMGKTAYNVVIGRGVAAIKGNEFIFQSLVKMDESGYWKRLSTGSTFESLNSDNIKNAIMYVPSKEEQSKIGTNFSNLDNLITLHQRECDHLKELKKSMLKKMFPRDGSSFPEVRFAGFTDAWEQRKLGDILQRRVEQKQQSEEYPRLAFASGQGVIPLSERKTNNREQLTKDEFTKKYLVTELDDIVYNPANVKYGAIDRNKYGRGLISPIYVTFTTSEISGFIERIVTSHDFQQRALRFEEGTVTKRQSVNPEDLITLDILIAPQREEQRKISECFGNLDNLITLHQRELEILKNLKKTCLKRMFI